MDWNKIIRDTDNRSNLSDKQRYWRCLALLRLDRIDEASQCFQKGKENWKVKSRQQILLADLWIIQRSEQRADALLQNIYPSILKDDELKKSWKYTAQKIRAPSERLNQFLMGQEPDKNWSFKTIDEWHKAMRLKSSSTDPQFWVQYLEWLSTHQTKDLNSAIQAMIHSMNRCPWQKIYQILKKIEAYDLITEYIFWPATRDHTNPEDLWRRWHTQFARHARPKLREAMIKWLNLHPNESLETYLKEIHPAHSNQT